MTGVAANHALELPKLEDVLLNKSGSVPLAQRFRALFSLRANGTHQAIDIIGQGFQTSGALLGHELAYCLGQIGDPYALPILHRVLEDCSVHPMVRHEAAEAMGAISHPSSLPLLRQYLHDDNISVRETCEIALSKIEWDQKIGSKSQGPSSQYGSIDPAPSWNDGGEDASIPLLASRLMDPQLSLFERYRAMFTLRDDASKDAVLALASGFRDPSALFRHEIAYVFGQMSSPHSVPALLQVLRDDNESDMVRHEAAEALGSIATPDVLPTLHEYRNKGPEVVRESCEVALDMYDYEHSGQLDYALTKPTRS